MPGDWTHWILLGFLVLILSVLTIAVRMERAQERSAPLVRRERWKDEPRRVTVVDPPDERWRDW